MKKKTLNTASPARTKLDEHQLSEWLLSKILGGAGLDPTRPKPDGTKSW